MAATDTLSNDAFALPTKSVFALEKSKGISLSLLSTNADTHYSIGMSYLLLLSDMEEAPDETIRNEWIEKSHLHLTSCASIYACMMGKMCDIEGYDSPDDVAHVNIDGEAIGWKNFEEDGYLKTALGASSFNGKKEARTSSKVIKTLRERIRNVKTKDFMNIPIVESMKEMLNEIQDIVDSPHDTMKVLLSLSKTKGKVAVETAKKIKREAIEEGKKIRRNNKENSTAQLNIKSQKSVILPSMNGLSKKANPTSPKVSLKKLMPVKKQNVSATSPNSSSNAMKSDDRDKNPLFTPLKVTVTAEQQQNILSPSIFKDRSALKSNETTPKTFGEVPKSSNETPISSITQTSASKLDNNSIKASVEKVTPNLNMWQIGTPIFRNIHDKGASDNNVKEKTPLPSKNLQSEFQILPTVDYKSPYAVESSLWKNTPLSLKVKVADDKKIAGTTMRKKCAMQNDTDSSKKWKSVIRKKGAIQNVHANYDSKRHNRYRPMMKPNNQSDQEKNELSPSGFNDDKMLKSYETTPKPIPQTPIISVAQISASKGVDSVKKITTNLNMWQIGTPVFRNIHDEKHKFTLENKDDEKREEWDPLPSKNLQSEFQKLPTVDYKSPNAVESSLWKNTPLSLKLKATENSSTQSVMKSNPVTTMRKKSAMQNDTDSSKKWKSVIRKKGAIQNVRANYDSKRHNRYRPMMKNK